MIDKEGNAKLISFGISTEVCIRTIKKGPVSQLYATAPEVLIDNEYDEAADIWGVGVVLYIMLAGYRPFSAQEAKDFIDKGINKKIQFYPKEWSKISSDAKRMINALVTPDKIERSTAEKALLHPWI